MNRLQLATLLSWAGDAGIQGRKRLQKVVFFLQEAGCGLDCRYILHHFGPYSRDVADRCDEMVTAQLITERGGPANGDFQYGYTLKPEFSGILAQAPDMAMQQFQALGAELISENIWTLELGSTILYMFRRTQDWEQAFRNACEFKKTPVNGASQTALAFAKKFEVPRAV